MLTVGIAIRLGLPPSEVERWPLQDLADVAAYCQLEQEDFDKQTKRTAASSPQAKASPTARTTTTQSFRFVVKKKE
jgi:hypothetical protein